MNLSQLSTLVRLSPMLAKRAIFITVIGALLAAPCFCFCEGAELCVAQPKDALHLDCGCQLGVIR